MLLTNLTCFNRRNPIGIGATPYFGWKIESDNRDTMQRSYHIIVNDADGHNVWDSGIIFSERNAFIPYQGEPLKGCMPYRWQIEICDNHNCSATADARFETAILDRADWKAQWVASPFRQRRKKSGRQSVVFLNHFTLLRNVASARLYATAHGVYRVALNGNRADERELAPEFTVFEIQLLFQTYDVTRFLLTGENTIEFTVADGWFHGRMTRQKAAGADDRLACLWQLQIRYTDGSMQTICSGEHTSSQLTSILKSDLFYGEVFDANYAPAKTKKAVIAAYGYENLTP